MTDTVFMGCLVVTVMMSAAPLIYVLRVYSPNCGAFAGYTNVFQGFEIWARSENATDTDDNNGGLHTFLMLWVEPVVLYTVIMVLGIIIAYTKENLRETKLSRIELQEELELRARAEVESKFNIGGAQLDHSDA